MTSSDSASLETKEPQYTYMLSLAEEDGPERLGLVANAVMHDDPRRLVFLLSRYKFVSKLFEGLSSVLEVGCGDATGTRLVRQVVPHVVATDFDPIFIEDAERRNRGPWNLDLRVHDFMAEPIPEGFDGVYALDVLEHIDPEDEHVFLGNVVGSLSPTGVSIIGMPSLESQQYASPASKEGHINCKMGPELRRTMLEHFSNVFIFSMNDEVVHTGFTPMAHYLLAVCASPRRHEEKA